jgi:putative methionine-R-sulfoxide reductase with GAF domain
MDTLDRYRRIREQAAPLVAKTPDPIARRATVVALLHHKLPGVSWTGFYMLRGGELVLDVCQGPVACPVLPAHAGVCWAGIDRGEAVVVPDVHAFPGHVPCDARSRSEVVVPVRGAGGKIVGVLDLDSHEPARFTREDAEGLGLVLELLAGFPGGTAADAFADCDPGMLREILGDFARNWLAHDGVWFQAVETAHGMAPAMAADAEAWGRFAEIEAKRIVARFGLPAAGGLDALAATLPRRMYAALNRYEVRRVDERTLRFRMVDCRVQQARDRKGLAPFPCRPVGEVEFASFARGVDPRIVSRCIVCPPDGRSADGWCEWEFTTP